MYAPARTHPPMMTLAIVVAMIVVFMTLRPTLP
jgi:hypothetical protein